MTVGRCVYARDRSAADVTLRVTSAAARTARQQLAAAVDAQFPVDHLRVPMHRVPAELELGGDFLLGVALQEVPQHRSDPRREPVELRRRLEVGDAIDVRRVRVQQVNDRLLALAESRVAGAALKADREIVSVRQGHAAIERVIDVERPADDVEVGDR